MAINSHAQKLSGLGRFSVEQNKGCAPFTVSITSLDSFGDISRTYQFESFDETPSTNTTHTYNTADTFKIVQIVATNVVPTTDTLVIIVLEPELPDFTIHNCAGHTVRVEINNDYYEQYRVFFTPTDFEDVAPESFSSEYNYGTPGNYTITVEGRFLDSENNCGSETSGIVTVEDIVPPVLTGLEVTNKDNEGTIRINYNLGSDVIYELYQATNGIDNFAFRGNISGSTRTSSGINTQNNYFCYNINTFDACNNVTIYSDTLCTAKIHVATANGANVVTWDTDTTKTEGYTVIRNDIAIAEILDPSQVTYNDESIICNTEYCYKIQPIFNTGTSLSADTCVLATETGALPPLGQPFSTITDQSVVITWPEASTNIPLFRYTVEKSINGSSFRRLDSSTDPIFTDASANFIGAHAYRVTYADQCNNSSLASPATSPMIVTAPSRRGNIIEYAWTKYETWDSGIRNYTLERLDEEGALIEEFSVLSGRTWEITYDSNDDRPKNIRVRAESLDPTPLVSYSNLISTELETELFLPTAFTPNGNGLNDTFTATGPKVFDFEMQIYSRWGSLIFVTDDLFQGWDGQIGGDRATGGTYIYRVNFKDATGKEFNQSGSFVLLRQ